MASDCCFVYPNSDSSSIPLCRIGITLHLESSVHLYLGGRSFLLFLSCCSSKPFDHWINLGFGKNDLICYEKNQETINLEI